MNKSREILNHNGVIILMGLPGSGKGTQAKLVSKKFKIPLIEIGNVLRAIAEQDTELGNEIEARLANGNLMENKILAEVINQQILIEDFTSGFVIEGYPRNLTQALWFDHWLMERQLKSVAVLLSVRTDIIEERLLGRLVCSKCRATENTSENPLKSTINKCMVCRGTLMSRPDDNAETIRKRLATYSHSTIPVVSFFREQGNLIVVDGEPKREIVFENIMDSCQRLFSTW